MIQINIHEAKTHLSSYLARLSDGESILICRRNLPVAEIRSLPEPLDVHRPIGLASAEFSVPASFFDELPEDIVNLFAGGSE